MIEICLNVFIGYLLGSIPVGILVARLAKGPDPRTVGSGNPGTTNTIRSLGMGWGSMVFALDFLKGAFPVLLAPVVSLLPGLWGMASDMPSFFPALAAGMAAFAGHVFPLFARFHGGKGVATGAGFVMALMPLTLGLAVPAFLVVLLLSGMVSLASVLASLVLPACSLLSLWILTGRWMPSDASSWTAFGLCVVLAILIPVLHRKNIGRIRRGEESRFTRVMIFRRRDS